MAGSEKTAPMTEACFAYEEVKAGKGASWWQRRTDRDSRNFIDVANRALHSTCLITEEFDLQTSDGNRFSKRGYFWIGFLVGTFNALVIVIVVKIVLSVAIG